jgi:NitT/TauT family transport system substrate-binding protein
MAMTGKLGARAAIATAAFVATATLAACGGANDDAKNANAGKSGVTHITVGTSGQLSNVDVYLGMSQGTFAKAGLQVTPHTLTAGSNAIPLLLKGTMQFATVDLATAITATQQNVGVTAVAPNNVGVPGDIGYAGVIASPKSGIANLGDLEGKSVQVNQLNGTAEVLVKATVKKAGFDPSKVRFVEIPPPQALAALSTGRVDAAVLSEPNVSAALAAGMKYIANPEKDTIPDLPAFVFVASKAYVAKNPAVVKAFTAAVLAANKQANANAELARATAAKSTKLPAELLSKVTFPKFGEQALTAAHVQAYMDLLVQHGGLSGPAPTPTSVYTEAGA